MKTLPAGTLKYLLVDDVRVIANASRQKAAAPIAVVIEEITDKDGTRFVEHRGHHAVAEGPVNLAYTQHRPLVTTHRRVLRAGYATTGAVVLSETADETPSISAITPADPPAKPKKAPSKK